MIQRIQSLFFLLVIVCGVLALFSPFAVILKGDTAYVLKPLTHTLPDDVDFLGTWPIGVFWIIGILVIGATLLQYKNRKLQMRLSITFALLFLMLAVLEFYTVFEVSAQLGEGFRASYTLSSILPVVAAILCFMARNRIKKDEEMVKSVDRIR